MMSLTILLAEDDPNLAFMVANGLEDEGFSVFTIVNGNELNDRMQSILPDIAILDINLEGDTDGFEIAKEIRKKNPTLPLIFATGRTYYQDIRKGHQFGNVEYVKKPYSVKELVLYINKLTNKKPDISLREHSIGHFTFIPEEQVLLLDDERISLKKQEVLLLAVLSTHIDTVVNKKTLIDTIWNEKDYTTKENSLNNLLNSLRIKLSIDKTIEIITIPKTGYKLRQIATA